MIGGYIIEDENERSEALSLFKPLKKSKKETPKKPKKKKPTFKEYALLNSL